MPVSQTRGEVRAQPPLEGSAQQQACRGLGNTLVSYKCMQFNSFFWCHQKGAATSCSRFPPDLFSPRNGQSWSNSPPLYHFHALKKSFFFFCLFRAKPTAYGSSQARVESELQLPAHTTATATPGPRHVLKTLYSTGNYI